jgi:hypothetical protein
MQKHKFLVHSMCIAVCAVLISCSSGNGPYSREYLQGVADDYLAAMIAGDPSTLSLSDSLKYTENAVEMKVGEGLWASDSLEMTDFNIFAIDTVSNQVGYYGLLKNNSKPLILALRLKVENKAITEIEHVFAGRIGEKGMKNLVTPRPEYLEPVPVELRDTREKMFEIANLYFDAIEQDKGNVAPFAEGCTRHENGGQTTTNAYPDSTQFGDTPEEKLRYKMAIIDALSPAGQIDCQSLIYITRIQPRRLTIIDQKLGLVYGFPMFEHDGKIQWEKIIGVPGVDSIPKFFPAFNLQAGELFKIYSGKIYSVEANGFMLPYEASGGWD